ncbi:hypothetical protein QVD17_27640 [Tagetes erecta]|uniref:Uncharacterized protein n=1 Tax=Tagetes erecta TaxID=13708 RepID=A0AAD8KF79_TARER|nr:hypothetical protein QVD17_27640 [Tagetes erecta]
MRSSVLLHPQRFVLPSKEEKEIETKESYCCSKAYGIERPGVVPADCGIERPKQTLTDHILKHLTKEFLEFSGLKVGDVVQVSFEADALFVHEITTEKNGTYRRNKLIREESSLFSSKSAST